MDRSDIGIRKIQLPPGPPAAAGTCSPSRKTFGRSGQGQAVFQGGREAAGFVDAGREGRGKQARMADFGGRKSSSSSFWDEFRPVLNAKPLSARPPPRRLLFAAAGGKMAA